MSQSGYSIVLLGLVVSAIVAAWDGALILTTLALIAFSGTIGIITVRNQEAA